MIMLSATLHFKGTKVREISIVVYSSTIEGTAVQLQEPSQRIAGGRGAEVLWAARFSPVVSGHRQRPKRLQPLLSHKGHLGDHFYCRNSFPLRVKKQGGEVLRLQNNANNSCSMCV